MCIFNIWILSRSSKNFREAPPWDASCPRSECEEELVCGTSSVGPNLKRCTPATCGELMDHWQRAEKWKEQQMVIRWGRILKYYKPELYLELTGSGIKMGNETAALMSWIFLKLHNFCYLKFCKTTGPEISERTALLVNDELTYFPGMLVLCLDVKTYWTAWSRPSERWGTTRVGVLGTIRSSSS